MKMLKCGKLNEKWQITALGSVEPTVGAFDIGTK